MKTNSYQGNKFIEQIKTELNEQKKMNGLQLSKLAQTGEAHILAHSQFLNSIFNT